MTPESFAHALQHLDPGSRALLDLSVNRGLADDQIAELLGSDTGYVSSSREAAIAQLADDLGMHGDPERVREALGAMSEEAWRPQLGSGAVGQRDSGAENAQGQRGLTLIVLLVIAIVAAAVIASSDGGSKSTSSQKAPAPPAAPAKGGVSVQPLSASSPAKGSARLDGRSLTLAVSGLPRPAGSYEVWLYNDEIDAVPVTSFRAGNATVKTTLPKSWAGYRYLDISLEPADGNPNHSGQSLMRVPLRALRRA
jgi:anti-sigma-K factor RskA